MKLTKSQRLFIKAGEAQCRIMQYKYNIMSYDDQEHSATIAYYKKKRKQYIRRALEAYETEKLVAQASAYERGFCAGRRIK